MLQFRSCVDATRVELPVETSSRIGSLKEQLRSKLGYEGRVLFRSRELMDDVEVRELQLSEGEWLVVVPRRLEGPPEVPVDVGDEDVTLAMIAGATGQVQDNKGVSEQDSQLAAEVHNRIHDFMTSLFMAPQQQEEEGEEVGNQPPPLQQHANDNEAPNNVPANEPLPVPPVPQEAFEMLTGMGFSENAARKALLFCGGRTEAAMEWILEHEGDATLNEPITQAQIRALVASGGGRPIRVNAGRAAVPPPPRARAAPVFRVDEGIAARLQEMGFGAEQVSEALRVTRNNEQAAISYMLGDAEAANNRGDGGGGGGGNNDNSDDDEAGGMPASFLANPVLRALLLHPGIQDGLRNPRVLEAFRAIMVDPAAAPNYLNDPEVGPILLQVYNILQRHPNEQQQHDANNRNNNNDDDVSNNDNEE